MRAGLGQAQPIANTLAAEISNRYARLNEDQQRLVRDVLVNRDQIFGIQGGAGTGKTAALRAIKELAEERGHQTLGVGPTSRAAKGLKEVGIEAETVQAFLTRGAQPLADGRARLFFVDESSLASGRNLRDFLEPLRPSDRVLLIGDTRQHQSVEAGRIFDELQRAGMNIATLSKIVRQRDAGLRSAVEAMASGQIDKGVALLTEQNRVHGIDHHGDRFAAVARAFAEAPQGTLVVSPDNNSRRELNAAIRAELRENGQLQQDAFVLPVLVNRQEVTGEDRKVAASYHVGDSVRHTRGCEVLGLAAKSYATVFQVDAERNQITVQKSDGTAVAYDPARVKGVALYSSELRSFAIGERVQFTAPWKEESVSGRDLGMVTSLDECGNIAVKLDDSGRTVSWNLKDNKHLDYAYAMTSQSSQGATVESGLDSYRYR
jgi:ATP-dependent exoDNAse (exonuclease V) alpha subunit